MEKQRIHNDSDKNYTKMNAMIQALDNTGVCMFMYYPQTKTIAIPQNTCELYGCNDFYENMPHSFAADFVHEDDYDSFKEMYYKIDKGEKTATATFHSKDLNYCVKVTLTTVSKTEEGMPEDVFGLIENQSDLYKNEKLVGKLQEELAIQNLTDEMDKALKTVAISIGSQYFAVYYIWLESHTYICFQEKLQGILAIIGEKGQYEPAWDAYITGYIEEKDQASVREFIDISTLADRIGKKNSITITYRRKEIGWTRGQFIVGERDENGKILTVIYTVSDINEEMETKIKKEEAELEALRDPLTHIWNRKAFEKFKVEKNYKHNKTGFLLFDIDRFKSINDEFGHDVGDHVIKEVANTVKGVMRQNDLVFRVGGDEFAILMYNCDETIWKTMCRKIESIHVDIKQALNFKINVTISAGICVNEAGYCDEMYNLADQALYNTKINGRGGCSFIDLEGKITKEWHDQSVYLRKGDVLEKNSTVTWRMEIPKDRKLPIRMYGDDIYKDYMGITESASPEELNKLVIDRLEPEYRDILEEAAKATINEGHAEAVYLWNHPEKGKVQLRWSSSLDYETDEYYSIVGYIHIMKDMHVFTLEDVNRKIQNALENMYFCNFYIRLSDYSFKVYKAQPYMTELLDSCENVIDAVNAYITYMVACESKEEMKEFLDMRTVKQRLADTNILEKSYHDPNIGWASAKIVAVDRNKTEEVEAIALVVETLQ